MLYQLSYTPALAEARPLTKARAIGNPLCLTRAGHVLCNATMHAPITPPVPIETLLLAYRSGIFPMADRREDSEQGRFGYVVDPEGTLIELWQPDPADPSQNPPA